jgi:hypothetical protein
MGCQKGLPFQPIIFSTVQPGPPPQANCRAILQIGRICRTELSVEHGGEEVATLCTIRKGDVGAVFEVVVFDKDGVVDLSSAPTKDFIFGKAQFGSFVRPGVLVTDGTDGKIKYSTAAGEIDQVGEWRLQVRIMFPDLSVLVSETATFFVEPTIDMPVAGTVCV